MNGSSRGGAAVTNGTANGNGFAFGRKPRPQKSLAIGGWGSGGGGGNSHQRRPVANGTPSLLAKASKPSLANGTRPSLLANGTRPSLVSGTRPSLLSNNAAASAFPDSDCLGLSAVPLNGSSTYPKAYQSDLIVVLDMDECLIHSQFLSDTSTASTYAHQLLDKSYRRPSGPSNDPHPPVDSASSAFGHDEEAESIVTSSCESFRINLPDGDLVHVNKRPNLDAFIHEIANKFETYVFTAAMEIYAAPVLDKLEEGGTKFEGRFYREHCALDQELGVYVKDLGRVFPSMHNASDIDDDYEGEKNKEAQEINGISVLPPTSRFDERRVVLVDNNPLSFLANPSNGILVSNFYDDPKDDTLEAVAELLCELDGLDDVRPALDAKFGLKDALRDVVRNGAGWR